RRGRGSHRPRGLWSREPQRGGLRTRTRYPRCGGQRRATRCGDRERVRGAARLRGARRFSERARAGGRARAALGHRRPLLYALRPPSEVAGTKELDRKPLTERNRPHVEDPSIERLAEVAGHTDELAVR